ncbi:hypothetical protein K2173_009690 [Erythroxylum novogranatense]|uniref:RelA/SpoT domain-containing protein n=1 Tax=Erythroxylum novogranatense TaxID=1862640 RepID=A0AAV8U7U4_9ROSI|nr:hypothetical protein K2173_009690 [Erythroxylum novogranatense]
MSKKKLNMDEMHIHGLRLIVESEDDCYNAMKIVLQLWSQVPGKVKDYICHPKINGYDCLHTVVVGEGTVPLEIHIRTKEMHLQAEFGFGDCKLVSFVLHMVEWARWFVSWQCETTSKDNASSKKAPCTFPSPCDDNVFVPPNSMVRLMDLLARGKLRRGSRHGLPWKQPSRPKLNDEAVNDARCRLKMGDVVEPTPTIPIQRTYNKGSTSVVSNTVAATAGWRV